MFMDVVLYISLCIFVIDVKQGIILVLIVYSS
jgi:hypothetical protein